MDATVEFLGYSANDGNSQHLCQFVATRDAELRWGMPLTCKRTDWILMTMMMMNADATWMWYEVLKKSERRRAIEAHRVVDSLSEQTASPATHGASMSDVTTFTNPLASLHNDVVSHTRILRYVRLMSASSKNRVTWCEAKAHVLAMRMLWDIKVISGVDLS